MNFQQQGLHPIIFRDIQNPSLQKFSENRRLLSRCDLLTSIFQGKNLVFHNPKLLTLLTTEECGPIKKDLSSVRISSDTLISNQYWLHAFKKDFPMVEAFKRVQLRTEESGITGYWHRNSGKLKNFNPSAAGHYKKNENFQPLKMKNVLGSFLLLIIGLILSFCVFICELIYVNIK